MKKIFLLSLLLSFFLCFSQEGEYANEVKVDVIGLMSSRFGVSYERIISPRSGVGVRFFMKKTDDYYALPHYRYYFNENDDSRLFLEGFGIYKSYLPKDSEGIFYDDGIRNSLLGGGLSFGGKAFLSSRFIAEAMISSGIGAVLKPTVNDKFKLIIQIGVGVGYRFLN